MINLNPEQIQFIDKYLQKSDVIFVDLRAEMTDHIATAVEEKMQNEGLDFYDAFKNYMVVNKKEILKANKDQAWNFSFAVFKRFFLFLLKPKMILFAIFHFVILTVVLSKTGTSFTGSDHHLFFMWILITVPIAQFIYYYAILKKRFYYLEKSSILFVPLYYYQILFLGGRDTPVGLFRLEIFSYFFFCYILYFIAEARVFMKSNAMLSVNEA